MKPSSSADADSPHNSIRLSSVLLLLALLFGLVAPLASPPVAQAAAAVRSFGGGTNFPGNDDNSVGPVNLGFTINYFGTEYSQAYVNNNGNITFGGATSSYTPGGMSASSFKMIAGLWYDVDTRGIGSVYYGTGTVDGRSAFYVNYNGVGYYSGGSDRLNTFQIVVISRADTGSGNFDIEYNYDSVTYDPAGAGYSDGSGGSNDFQFAGSLSSGALLNSNPTTGLANYSTNSGVLGRHLLPVRGSTPFVVQLSSPADNATNIPSSTTLSWQSLAGATAFHVMVATDVGLTNKVVDVGGLSGSTTSYNVSGLASSTTYYWAVEATDGSNTTRSNVRRFTTSSNSPPTITSVAGQTVNEATATSALSFTVGDVQTPAASLTMAGSSSNTTLVPNGNIVFGGSGSSRTVTVTPAAGQYGSATITLTVTDTGGGSTSTSFTLTVNAVPRVTSPANDASVNTLSPTFSGQATVGALVTVMRGGLAFCTATANSSGVWSCSGPVPSEGPYSFTFSASLNGQTSATASRSLTVDVTVPTQPEITSAPIASDRTPVIAGTAEPNSSIRVSLDTNGDSTPDVTYATTANASGLWSLEVGVATPVSGGIAGNQLSDGSYAVRVTSTDGAGNVSPAAIQSLRIDASPPPAPVITTRAATNDRSPVLVGTAEANGTVTVGIDTDGNGSSDIVYSVAAGTDGSWSVDTGSVTPSTGTFPAAGLDAGAYTIRAAVTDAAGNTGATGTKALTIDFTSPEAPAFTSASLTNSANPTFSGTAEANSTVALEVDLDGDGAADVVYSTAANGAGAWSVNTASATPASGTWPGSGLASGGYSLSATATDAAGNLSLTSTQGLIVDRDAPAAPVINTADNANDDTPVFFGTAEPGSTVRVTFDPDGAGALGDVTFSVVVAADGTWSIDTSVATPVDGTFPGGGLADDSYALSITATDPAGNASTATAFNLTIDTSQPEAPSLTSAALTNDQTPTFSGFAEPGSTVRVTFDPDGAGALGNIIIAVPADPATGAWSVDTGLVAAGDLVPESGTWPAGDLVAGTYSVSFNATDGSSNVSDDATQSLVIDLTIPAAPLIDSALAGNDRTPTFAGTAEANSRVTVSFDPDGSGPLGDVTFTTMADGSGNWSIDTGTATPFAGTWPAEDLGDADYSVVVASADGAGNLTTNAPVTLHIDTAPPASPVFTTPLSSDTTPSISGTAEANSHVTLTIDLDGDGDSDLVYQVTAGADGAWVVNTGTDAGATAPTSGTFPADGLEDGSYAITATATDAYANLSLAATQQQTIDTTPPAAPTFVSGALTNNRWPVIEGYAEPNSTIEVTIAIPASTDPVYVVNVGPSGAWRLDTATANPTVDDTFPVDGLDDGSYTVSVTATDAAGNTGAAGTQNLSVDATPPDAPTITSSASSNDKTPLFTGTADANSAVTLGIDLNGDNNPDVIYATTTNAQGDWSVATPGAPTSGTFPGGGLNDAVYAVRVLVTDQIGNTSPAALQAFTVDTIAPARPTITSAADSSDPTPALSGTAEPGSTVSIGFDLNGNGTPDVTFTAVAAANGSWSLDTAAGGGTPADTFPAEGLSDAAYTVTVTASDTAGNTSLSQTQSLKIDTQLPAAPQFASSTSLNDPTPSLNGTAEPNSIVLITIDVEGDDDPVYRVIADAQGDWSFDSGSVNPTTGTFPGGGLVDGAYTLRATATDAAGNVSGAATQHVTIDTLRPGVPVIATPATLKSHTPVFSGTAEPNTSLTLSIDLDNNGTADVRYQVPVEADGSWSLDTSDAQPSSGSFPAEGMADGTYRLSVVASDAAGNLSFAANQTLAIDTVAPSAATFISPISTNDRTPIFLGTAEPNSTITIRIDLDDDGDADVGFTTKANLAGNWSIDTGIAEPTSGSWPALGLPEGDYTLLATVADAADNQTASSRALEIDLTALTPPSSDIDPATTSRWPLLSGSAAADSLVTVAIDLDGDGTLDVTFSTTAGPDGSWSVDTDTALPATGTFPGGGLADGGYHIVLTTTDEAGNVSAATNVAMAVDTESPTAPSIGSADTTNDPTPVLRGTAEPGSTVMVGLDLDGDGTPDVTFTTTATAPTGAWSVDLGSATPALGSLPDGGLPAGSVDMIVWARDAAGNDGARLNQTLEVEAGSPDPLAVTTPLGTDDPTPALRGVAAPGATVTVTLDLDGDDIADVTFTTTANEYGAWRIDLGESQPVSGTFPEDGLSDATYDVVITTSGPDGHDQRVAQELTIDTQAPARPAISTPARSSDRTPTFSGTAEPGSMVTVGVDLDGDGAFDVFYSTIAVAPTGNWSIDTGSLAPDRGSLPPGGLPEGSYILGIWATDGAGNAGPLVTQQLLVDLTVPAAPTQGSAAQTGDRTPILFGTAEPGSTVLVGIDLDGDGNPDVTFSTTADTTGRWSLPTGDVTPVEGTFPPAGLSDGSYSVNVTAIDTAGNRSATSRQTLVLDGGSPVAPTIASVPQTNDGTPSFSGEAQPGSTVKVAIDVDGDGTPDVTFTTTADPAGLWSVDTGTDTPEPADSWPADGLPAGDHLVRVTATTGAGVSTAATQTLLMDTDAPDAPVVSMPEGNNDLWPVFGGTAEPGSTVKVAIDLDGDGVSDVTFTTIAESPSGAWIVNAATMSPSSGTFPMGGLPSGTHDVVVTVTDPAGNVSAEVTGEIGLDTSDPEAPTMTMPAKGVPFRAFPILAGAAEPHSVVTVVVDMDGDPSTTDDIVTYEVRADADGKWRVDTESATPVSGSWGGGLLEGETPAVRIIARDAAGNTSSAGHSSPSVDTIVPEEPESTTPENTIDTTPTFTGRAEPGGTVRLTLDIDGDPDTDDGVVFEAEVDAEGNWSIDTEAAQPIEGTFPEGGIPMLSKVTGQLLVYDPAGNASTALALALDVAYEYYLPIVFQHRSN